MFKYRTVATFEYRTDVMFRFTFKQDGEFDKLVGF